MKNKTLSNKTLMLQGLGEVITGLQKIQKALANDQDAPDAAVPDASALDTSAPDTPVPETTCEQTTDTVTATPPPKTYSTEEVRGVLSAAAHNGHRDEVIQILKDHGAKNITELKEGDYAEVVAQAEALSHAG